MCLVLIDINLFKNIISIIKQKLSQKVLIYCHLYLGRFPLLWDIVIASIFEVLKSENIHFSNVKSVHITDTECA